MKKMTAILVCSALGLSEAAIQAQQQEPRGKKPFAEMDSDRDGTVSAKEWTAFNDKIFSEADADKNGVLSRDELKAFHDRNRSGQKK